MALVSVSGLLMNYFLLKINAGVRPLGWVLAMLGLLLALARPAQAQFPTSTDPLNVNPAAPVIVRPDTATVRKMSKKEKRALAAADSAKRTERLFGFHVTRPQKAGYLALIPSGGQIYNRKYWKLPIVYGMVGGFGFWIWYQQRYFHSYKYADSHRDAAVINAATDDIPDDILRAQLASYVTSNPNAITNGLVGSRRFRDLSLLISGLGYGLQILDAVVDAHLHDFDVSDNLALDMQPTLLPVPGQLMPAAGFSVVLRAK